MCRSRSEAQRRRPADNARPAPYSSSCGQPAVRPARDLPGIVLPLCALPRRGGPFRIAISLAVERKAVRPKPVAVALLFGVDHSDKFAEVDPRHAECRHASEKGISGLGPGTEDQFEPAAEIAPPLVHIRRGD